MPVKNQSIKHRCIEPLYIDPGISRWNTPQYWCSYNPEQYQDDLFKTFNIRLPNSLSKAINLRKAEYLAGRYCAQQVLEYYGEKYFCLNSGQNRNPVWPRGMVGSISHGHGLACCVAEKDSRVIGLGVDIEREIDIDTVREISKLIVSDDDIEILKSLAMTEKKAFTLAFSVKESFFKAAFPIVNSYFDFDVIGIRHIDTRMKTIELILNRNLNKELNKGRRFFANYFTVSEDQIATLIHITR